MPLKVSSWSKMFQAGLDIIEAYNMEFGGSEKIPSPA